MSTALERRQQPPDEVSVAVLTPSSLVVRDGRPAIMEGDHTRVGPVAETEESPTFLPHTKDGDQIAIAPELLSDVKEAHSWPPGWSGSDPIDRSMDLVPANNGDLAISTPLSSAAHANGSHLEKRPHVSNDHPQHLQGFRAVDPPSGAESQPPSSAEIDRGAPGAEHDSTTSAAAEQEEQQQQARSLEVELPSASPGRSALAAKSPRAGPKRVSVLRRELAALCEPNALNSRPRVVSKPGTSTTGRTTNNSQSQFFLMHGDGAQTEEEASLQSEEGALLNSENGHLAGGPEDEDKSHLHSYHHDHHQEHVGLLGLSPSITTNGGGALERLEVAKKQFMSLVCSFTSVEELNAFSFFASHVLYQQRTLLAKSAASGSAARAIEIPPPPPSMSVAQASPRSGHSMVTGAGAPPHKVVAPPSPDRRGGKGRTSYTQQQQQLLKPPVDTNLGITPTKKRPRGKKAGAGVVTASGSDDELESDGEFDPAASPRTKGGKRAGLPPKRAKRKRTRTNANEDTLRSAISEVCDIDLKGIINGEVFEKEFSAEEKDRLMLLLPEVDRSDPQVLVECLRFNTHLNVAMQQYQQIQRAGHLEDSDDAAFIARPQRQLDPWKAKYFEEYWGQRLGLPPPPPVRDTRTMSIATMELPTLTQTNLERLAFSYSRQQQQRQEETNTRPQALDGAHSGGSSGAATSPSAQRSGVYDAPESVPPRKRKLDQSASSSLSSSPSSSSLPASSSSTFPSREFEDRTSVSSGPPSPSRGRAGAVGDEASSLAQRLREASNVVADGEGFEDDDDGEGTAAAGGKAGSLTKRRRVRSTTALPHAGFADDDTNSVGVHSSSSRSGYGGTNGRSLPPKKSHKQNVGGGHRPRASSSLSPSTSAGASRTTTTSTTTTTTTASSTRATEQEILEEFNGLGGLGDFDVDELDADLLDDGRLGGTSPRGRAARKKTASNVGRRRQDKGGGGETSSGDGAAATKQPTPQPKKAGGGKKAQGGPAKAKAAGAAGVTKLKDPVTGNDLTSGASFRRGAEIILKREGKPMDAREIVRVGLKEGLFSTKGKTPQNTLASLLYMDIKNNRQSIFVKVKPMTFGLKEFDEAVSSSPPPTPSTNDE